MLALTGIVERARLFDIIAELCAQWSGRNGRLLSRAGQRRHAVDRLLRDRAGTHPGHPDCPRRSRLPAVMGVDRGELGAGVGGGDPPPAHRGRTAVRARLARWPRGPATREHRARAHHLRVAGHHPLAHPLPPRRGACHHLRLTEGQPGGRARHPDRHHVGALRHVTVIRNAKEPERHTKSAGSAGIAASSSQARGTSGRYRNTSAVGFVARTSCASST